jgi:hypothetical protein
MNDAGTDAYPAVPATSDPTVPALRADMSEVETSAQTKAMPRVLSAKVDATFAVRKRDNSTT